jgi:hypothetical protein
MWRIHFWHQTKHLLLRNEDLTVNLKMKTLAAAMIAAGTLGSAQAAEILFPYVVNSATVTTVVSVMNANITNTGPGANLHYRLWYKDGANAEVNSANCLETDVLRSTSFADIQTIDLGGKFGASTLGVLFNDPSINNNWKGANKSYALASFAAKPLRGWMLVDDNSSNAQGVQSGGSGALQGEAMVFEFVSGAAWGYQAGVGDVDFGSGFTDPASNINFGNNSAAYVNFAPFAETETKFFVTPLMAFGVSPGMNGPVGNNNDNPTGTTADGYRLSLGGNGFAIFDRDENVLSGMVPQDVTCVGSVNAKTLISGATLAQVPDGGWSILNGAARGNLVAGTNVVIGGATVIKLDYNTKATFNGEATSGVYNNAFVLKGLMMAP